MEVLLVSGKSIEVDDASYVKTDLYSGETTHIFTSKKTGTIYTVKDTNIIAFGEKLTAETLDRITTVADDDDAVEDLMFV